MPACKTLRLDPGDGSLVQDYRIANGGVEMRVFHTKRDTPALPQWRRVSREQLVAHVMENTVVAQWLQRRMGVRPLIRTCSQQEEASQSNEQNRSRPLAA